MSQVPLVEIMQANECKMIRPQAEIEIQPNANTIKAPAHPDIENRA